MTTRHSLLRCLLYYRRIPGRFAAALSLYLLLNGSLVLYQHLVGRAVHDLERGAAVVRTADGGLDARVAWSWAAILLGVAVARALIQYIAGIVALMAGQELLTILRQSILQQVLRLDLAFHLRHGAGEMVSRTTRDADKVRDALVNFWRNVIETLLAIVASLVLLVWYDPWLALVPAALMFIGAASLLRQSTALVTLDRAIGAAYDDVNQDLIEGVNGVRVIKAFRLETARIARFDRVVARFVEHATRALAYASSRVPVPQVIVALGQVWVLGAGAVMVTRGRMNLGELVAAALAMNTLVFRFEGVGRIMQIFADARASAGRIMELLDARPSIQPGQGRLPAAPLGVRLDDVTVRLPGGQGDILTSCSLRLNPGETVAIVGGTGSGKSTLTALLPRLLDASTGSVLIGSDQQGWTDVRTLDLDDLRRRVHVVPQDCFLFSDTLAANVALGRPDATREQMREALRLAAADDVVTSLADGLDGRIGDRGVTLSGGQRQRVALARALIARPAVLVLDDATSALDAVTERTILQNIRDLASTTGQPVSLLIVASKPASVRFADRTVVLAAGRIEAEGTERELIAISPTFRELMGEAHAHRRAS